LADIIGGKGVKGQTHVWTIEVDGERVMAIEIGIET
jgi:hypothetical protein